MYFTNQSNLFNMPVGTV